jgi:DNA-binding response OmpR family regulator
MMDRKAYIVEDDPHILKIFSEAVRKAGYITEGCPSGEAFLACVVDATPDLVVLDLHLPGISGEDVLHRIRSTPQMQKAVVILASADPLVADLYRDEADFVMIKPVSFGQLRDLAARLLR